MTHTELTHPQRSLVVSKARGRKEKEKPESLAGGSVTHSWPRTIQESTTQLGIFSSPIQFASNTLCDTLCDNTNCPPAATGTLLLTSSCAGS